MPNHCRNVLNVRGEACALANFKILAATGTQREVLTFGAFYPLPPDVLTGDTGGATFARKPGEHWQPFAVLSLQMGLESIFEGWGEKAADFRAQLQGQGYEVKWLRFGTTQAGEIIDLDADPRPTWYDWRIDTFGTKWELYDSSLRYMTPDEHQKLIETLQELALKDEDEQQKTLAGLLALGGFDYRDIEE